MFWRVLYTAGDFESTRWFNVARDYRRQLHRHSVVHTGAVNPTTDQLLHSFTGSQRPAYW